MVSSPPDWQRVSLGFALPTRLPQAAALGVQAPSKSEFVARLTKSYQDEKLGIGVVWLTNTHPVRFIVINVRPTVDSPVNRWNSANLSLQVMPGHHIVAVNNMEGQHMAEEMSFREGVIELRLLDPSVVLPSDKPMASHGNKVGGTPE